MRLERKYCFVNTLEVALGVCFHFYRSKYKEIRIVVLVYVLSYYSYLSVYMLHCNHCTSKYRLKPITPR